MSGVSLPAMVGEHGVGPRAPIPEARRRKPGIILLICVIGCAGCAESNELEREAASGVSAAPASARVPGAAPADSSAPANGEVSKAGEKANIVPRKIIYNARVDLVVKSLKTFSAELSRLVAQSGGVVSESDVYSSTKTAQQAKWVIRVPVDRFDSVLDSIGVMGELQTRHIDSQDVSREYYDTEARITNKQQEEKRLLKHLADSTGKLEDILAVEKELTRVRGEIELMQGRIRYLANLTSLSTITVTAVELGTYTPAVAPTFATQIRRAFGQSIDALLSLGKAIVLFGVVMAPWVVVLLIVGLPLLIIWRWFGRRMRRPTPPREPRFASTAPAK